MEDTSCGSECAFVKNGMCKTCKECPNYVESWWTKQGETQPKIIRDCSPKRLLLQQQYLQLRLEQLTASIEDQRNHQIRLAEQLKTMVEMSNAILQTHAKTLEFKNEKTVSVNLLRSTDVPMP
jgi:hypothetical protein